MDDGIELNFAPPSANGASPGAYKKVAQKGGRWTDRAKARKEVRKTNKPFDAPQAQSRPEREGIVERRAPAAASVHVPAPKTATAMVSPAPKTRAAPAIAPAPAVAAARVVSRPTPAPATARAQPTATKRVPSMPVVRPPQLDSESEDDAPQAGPSRPRPAAAPTPAPAPKTKPQVPQVISSLFTGTTTFPRPAPIPSTPTVVGAPSNAPLGDTSTFEGLGLHRLLTRHLKGKMAIKAPTGIQRSALPHMLASPLDLASAHAVAQDDEEDDYEVATAPKETQGVETPRDVFIQSQTGSGKTLTYLLPIIQTLLPLSRLSYIDRSIGTLAIILAPTRELAQQISKVLEQLLSLSLATDPEADDDNETMTRWLVSGLLTGGSTKTHEKAKLRKGVPILVATPGRLLDHLQNTTSFKFAKTMFLVLDEADRLMDLGFEETITGIMRALDGRRRAEMAGESSAEAGMLRWGFWGRGRQNVLCSATVDGKVAKLAGMALRDPVVFRSEPDAAAADAKRKVGEDEVRRVLEDDGAIIIPTSDKFTPPSQLAQKFVVAPTKLRLVSLVALVRTLIGRKVEGGEETGRKVIVFMSTTDAVDFHWKLLGGVQMGEKEEEADDEEGQESADEDGSPTSDHKPKVKAKPKKVKTEEPVSLASPLFPSASIHRLHGSLPLRTRLASLAAFAAPSPDPSVLVCTSVASRGLDMPLVSAVVQYDLPTEGGANEYVHRVGRTARAGKGGEAWAFVAPSEREWVPWVAAKMGRAEGKGQEVGLGEVGVEDVLKKGFGGRGFEFERRATEVQGGFERWVVQDDKHADLARKAFASFVRAYSTHPLEEKRFFHPKSLHLGHLAKAFALREAPGAMAALKAKTRDSGAFKGDGRSADVGANTSAALALQRKRKKEAAGEGASDDEDEAEEGPRKKGGKELTARNETERRMYEAVRRQGREVRSGGKMGRFGDSSGGKGAGQRTGGGAGKDKDKGKGTGVGAGMGGEYQVMHAGELERMLAGKK